MTKESAAQIIAVEMFTNLVNQLEENLTAQRFRTEVKYHAEAINNALQKDFQQIVEILQNVVDKFYWSKYEVNGFLPFNSKDFDAILKHNLELVRNCKKLCKFIA